MKAVRFLSSLAAVALVACSGGPGTSGTIKIEPREPPGTSGAPESPGKGESPEPTSGGPEAPNGDAGAASSNGNGGVGSCPACDQSYTCTVSGQSGSLTITLATQNGECIIEQQTPLVFSCDGTITSSTGLTVPWIPFGNGGFSVIVQNEPETCVPAGAAVPPPGSSTSGS